WVRWGVIFGRRAREITDPDSPTDAAQRTLREQAPSVVGTVVITAAIMVAPAVLGRSAGLELLHPFAIAMLAGLLTATAAALIGVPTCYLLASRRAGQATTAP